jgi:hypothetical protein
MTHKAASAFILRRGLRVDALAILEAKRSAIRGTAAAAYSRNIIEEWAPAIIAPEVVIAFEQWIERSEEQIVVAVHPGGRIIGFGSIVPSNSELRAAFSPDGQLLAVGVYGTGIVWLIDATTGAVLAYDRGGTIRVFQIRRG